MIIEKSRLKASKHFVFHGAKAYEPPAFGVRPLERIEVKKYVVRGDSFKLAEKALKLLEEVRRYRQNAVLATPWLARMENNLQVIARNYAKSTKRVLRVPPR